ncbi:uncharacterized protein [Drosophila takahashii]|uniref:uncharacterized protein n=1 Tax=Drosophila takahashii TaxID=29030 RepID=UPI00389953CA
MNDIERINSVTDLGVLFSHNLNFTNHIGIIVSKEKGVFAFVKRWPKEFEDPYTTKHLYISLVRPILEYCSCVWSPQYAKYQDLIELVKKQFLLFALRGLNWEPQRHLPSYVDRLRLLNLPSLMDRRTCQGVMFLHKLITGLINSSFLLGQIRFSIPVHVTPPEELRNTERAEHQPEQIAEMELPSLEQGLKLKLVKKGGMWEPAVKSGMNNSSSDVTADVSVNSSL